MGYARYVGRVGGLAVALGVGVAVATTPGVAWAGPSDSDSTTSSTSSDSTSSSSGPNEGSGSNEGSSESSGGGEDGETKVDAGETDAGEDASSGTDDSEGAKKAAGSTVKDKKSGSDFSAPTPKKKAPKRAGVSTPSDTDVSTSEPAADTSVAVQPKPEPVSAPPATSDVSVVQVTTSTTKTSLDEPPVVSEPESVDTPLSSTLLSAVGLAPSADGDVPEVPGESPVLLAMLAAFRRQTQQSLVGEDAATLKVADPSQSSLIVAAANSAPTVAPVVGAPDQSTGAVVVSLNATDADGNPLIYAVTGQPTGGSLQDLGGGQYRYTPSVASRLAAATTTTPDFDSFTVSVSDDQGGLTPVTLSVPKLPAVWANQPSSSNTTGAGPSGVAVVGDLAYVANSGTNTVTVINTKTGAVVGSPIVVGTAPTGVLANADGSRVYVANRTSGTISVIRTSDNTVVGSVRVGTNPEQMALNSTGTKLYVTNYGSSNVSVVNVSGQTPTLIKNIAVGANPRGIAFATVNGQPRVYVTRYNSSAVAVIDANTDTQIDVKPSTSTVDSITVGANPQSITVSQDGTRAYVTNFGSNTVSVINTTTNTVDGAAITVGSKPVGVSLSKDGSLLYVANSNDTVSVIDTKTRATVATLQIDTAPEVNNHYLTMRSDGSLVVTDTADRTVRVVALKRGNTAPVADGNPAVTEVNSTTGTVTGMVNIKDWDGDPLTYSYAQPASGTLTVSASGVYTYTPNAAARQQAVTGGPTTATFTVRGAELSGAYKDASVTVPITPASQPTTPGNVTPIGVGSYPVGVAVSGNQVYVANTGDNTVSVYNTTTHQMTTIQVGWAPTRIAAAPTTGKVYVANYDSVSVIDTTTNQVTATVAIPNECSECYAGVYDVAVSPDGSRAYAAVIDGTISAIDTSSNSVVSTTQVGFWEGDIEITPDGRRLYSATGYGSNSISVVDTQTMAVTRIPVGPQWDLNSMRSETTYGTVSLAVSPDGKRTYVTTRVITVERGVGGQTNGWFISDNQGRNWLVTGEYHTLTVVDTDPMSANYNTEIARTIVPAGATDVALSPDGQTAYVTHSDGKTVTEVDTTTNAVVDSFITDSTSGSGRLIAVGSDGTLYITDADENKLYAVGVGDAQASTFDGDSARTMSMMSFSGEDAQPMMLTAAVNAPPSASPTVGLPDTVDGKVTGSLNAVDADGNPLTYTVQSQSAGTQVTVTGSGTFTYTPSTVQRLQAATTSALDTDTFTVRVSDGQTFTDVPVTVVVRPGQLAGGTPVDVGRDPSAVAFNADGSTAYVTNKYDKTVSVINTTNGAVLATIKVPYSPTAVVVSPVEGQNRAYVAMTTGVAVIDTANNKVVDLNTGTATVDVIKVGSTPSAIAINPAGTRLYVSNGGSSTVSVIDTATNKEITRVTVGSQPSGLAVSPDGTRLYALNRYNDRVTVIRTADNVVIGTATVGDSPRNVVVSPDGQRIYVSNFNSGTVTVLNTAGTTPVFVKTITVGTQPDGIAMTKDGSLVYVANGRDTVSVIDTRSNTVIGSAAPIDSPAELGAHAIAVNGDKIYVTDYVDDWVRTLTMTRVQTAPQANGAPIVGTPNPNTGTIVGDLKVIDTDGDLLSYSVVDAPDKGVLTVNPNGTYTYTPTAVARAAADANTVDTFTVRVTDSLGASKDASVTVPISPAPLPPNRAPYANATGWGTEGDLATGLITGRMNGVDPDGDPLTYAVWHPSRYGTVTVNATTGEFTYIPTLAARLNADTTAGKDYDSISISVSDGRATTNYSMPVYVAPARAGVAQPISVGQDPTGVAVSGNQVFVLNLTDKTMSVIGPNSTSTMVFSSTPTAVAVTPDGSRAYVALSGTSGTVAVIDTATKQIVKTVTVGTSPAGVAVSQDGRRVYVTNSGSGTVSVIDADPASATYNTELRRITVGSQPTGIAVAPDGRRLYVTRPGGGSVAVVDTVTNAVAANVSVGGAPRGVAITPDGRHAYVTNDDGTVSVIDTANNFVVNRIAVGPSPLGVAIGREGTAFVANGDDTVSLIDTGKQSVYATIALSPQTATGAHYVAVNADATRIYVTDTRDDILRGLTITRGNTAPEINPYVPVALGTPNTSSGAVTGSVNATDPEVDRLTYSASAPVNGIVTIDAATGNFTYTPSQAARDFALTTEQNEVDTFTITVSDGQATANTIVTVPVMATNNVAPEWQNQTNNYDPVTRTTTGTVIAGDADGDTLRYSLAGDSYAGSATVSADGSYVYTPFYTGPNGYWNYDYIPIAITDGHYTTYAWIYVDTYTEYCGEACAL